jgi:manganese/zinc/iron transport system substrate-binding protein
LVHRTKPGRPHVAVSAAAAVGALVVALAAAGCARVDDESAAPPVSGDRPVRAVATIGMIGDVVAAVGGSRVRVETLMGPGVDPHLYKASEGDVQRLADADVVFYNGLHLEAKLADVLERLREGRAAAVTDTIPRARLLAPPEFAGNYDPHVWFDVRLWIRATERIGEVLAARDPRHADEYRRRARAYIATLRELDGWVRGQVARVPPERRVLVTAHDAFNYFGRAYDFEVRGLQGISTASEAGTADIRRLARFIAQRRIPTLFVESSVSPRAIEAVREAVRARGFDVVLGEPLFSDAMGDPGTPEGTYRGMVRHNVRAIVDGLLGGPA